MHSAFSFSLPVWLLIFCVALGALYSGILYWRERFFSEKTAVHPAVKYLLASARFICVTLLAALLLGPVLSWRHTDTNKPIVALLQDNSESVRYHFSAADSTAYFKKWKELSDRLSEKYEVVNYAIGSSVKPGTSFQLNDKATNLSDAIEDINDRYYNRNLGAVVLASDGIFNQGINPVYAAAQAGYSIYTVALGDTTVPRDVRVSNVLFNKIAYLNDQFSIRAEIEATDLAGKSAAVTVSEIAEGKPGNVWNKTFSINGNAAFQPFDFIVPANKSGIVHYRVEISHLEGEATYRNNTKDIFVEILDGRQKIALIANSPHPDIAAFKQSITSNKNYQLDIFYANDFNAKLNEYNLIILHQLPSLSNKIAGILQQANELKKPLLFVLGSQSDFNSLQKAEAVVGGNISPNRFNDVTARFNSSFSAFTLDEATLQAITKWPPLQNFFGEYKANAAAQTLLFQKINNVETDYPLVALSENSDMRQGVICGEGIWRWRLYNYEQNKNHQAFDEVVNKVVQFLAVKGDKRPFRVSLPKNIFEDNESVTFDAQLYNSNFELVNTPDADLKIRSEDGKEYPFKFNRTENYYSLNAGFLPVGNYSFAAAVKLGNNAYKADGKFSIAPLQLEEIRTVADHRVLYQLASQHGGTLFYPNNFEKIAEELLAKNKLKAVLYDTFKTNSAINLKWLFFLLAALLSLEWLVRKYLGGY